MPSWELLKADVRADGDENWGNIYLTQIRNRFDKPITFATKDFLGIKLLLPGRATPGNIGVTTSPWRDYSKEINHYPKFGVFEVIVKITFQSSTTPGPDLFQVDSVQFGVPGDPRGVRYTLGIELWKNHIPFITGTVPVECPPRPEGINQEKQPLIFANEDGVFHKEVSFGQKSYLELNRGKYQITGPEVSSPDKSTTVVVKVEPDQVEVEQDRVAATVSVKYEINH